VARTQMITDDLDGSPNAQPVRFSLEGRTYEIDLSSQNTNALRRALAKYLEKATEVTDGPRTSRVVSRNSDKPRRTRSPKGSTQQAQDRKARQWALGTGLKINGRPVGTKGRLHPIARQAWVDAGKPEPAGRS
jgi:hypothetical protein